MDNPFIAAHQEHLVLAQYHRWYQVYEVPFTPERIDNQKDILSDDVEITSPSGTTKGKADLEDRLKIFTGWRNAHHVKRTDVSLLPDGNLSLEADIIYQNIRPDSTQYCYKIHYSTLLRPRENDLPLFTKVALQPAGVVELFTFEDAYHENRSKSFMHYWLYLMENLHLGARFKELLAPGFTLYMSAGIVAGFDSFELWMSEVKNQIMTSTHSPKKFSSRMTEEGTIQVSADFEWKGIRHTGEKMTGETHHEWILKNNPDERFARMKEMKVSQTKPFQVVKNF